jgi:hypothetical protein
MKTFNQKKIFESVAASILTISVFRDGTLPWQVNKKALQGEMDKADIVIRESEAQKLELEKCLKSSSELLGYHYQ